MVKISINIQIIILLMQVCIAFIKISMSPQRTSRENLDSDSGNFQIIYLLISGIKYERGTSGIPKH